MFRTNCAKIFSVPDWSDTSTKTYDLSTVAGREQVPINLDEVKGVCFIYVRENNEYYRLISDTTSGTTRTLVFNGSKKITITVNGSVMNVEFSAGADDVGVTDTTLTLSGVPADAKATGDAIGEVSNDLNKVKENSGYVFKTIPFELEQGTYQSTNGGKSDSNYRVRCVDAIQLSEDIVFTIPSVYQIAIFFYNSVETHSADFEGKTDFLDGGTIRLSSLTIPDRTKYIRFVLRWKETPNNSITTTDIENVLCEKREALITGENAERYGKNSLSPAITFIIKDGMVTRNVPPNSIYAIKMSAHNQYDKIRFSVTKTTDGKYVAVHNVTINDLACNPDGTNIGGSVATAGLTLAELNQYDWGLKFGSQYAGLKVPMLEDCIALATQYNLTIALDLKWTPDQTDVEAITLLLAKYGQTTCTFFALSHPSKLLFKAECNKFSYLFTGDVSTFTNHLSWISELHTGVNKVYWALRPADTLPTEEAMLLAAENDVDLLYGPVEGFDELIEIGFASGINVFECRYIENIKSSITSYTDELIV